MTTATDLIKLHIGGKEPREGWSILNIQAGDGVDYVGDCCDMSQIETDSVGEIYACHVLEHLSYQGELQRALAECRRVLKPGGMLRISVPSLPVLCSLLTRAADANTQVYLMRILYGGQINEYDHHKTGFTYTLLVGFLANAGFPNAKRVERFGLFNDCSGIEVNGILISLNVEAS